MGIKERRERERNARRGAILDAAMQVYHREGYHATTMEKIAEEAELSRGTLYLYFKTKDEIFVYAIVEHAGYFARLLESIFHRREKIGAGIIGELWNSFQMFYEKDPVRFDATLYFHQGEMIRQLPDALRLMLDRSGSLNYRWLCEIAGYGIQKGYFTKCNPKTLAEVVWTSFLGIIHIENSKKAMSRKNHHKVAWELASNLLARGLRNRES